MRYEAKTWGDAFDALQQADAIVPLDPDDLERLAWSAGLIGKDDVFLGALERLHKACVELGERERAARAAFWIGFRLLLLGSRSGATGWLARAGRLLEHVKETSAERGYLLLPTVYRELAQGSDAEAEAVAREAAAIGERWATVISSRSRDSSRHARSSVRGEAHRGSRCSTRSWLRRPQVNSPRW